MKKIISLILAILMVACIFAGCSGGGKGTSYTDDGEQVTLKWVMGWSVQADFNKVQDIVNEKLAEKLPNTKLELVLDSALDEKWQLWMAGQQEYDIAHTGFSINLAEEITKKSFIGLNDLIENYAPTIKKEREETYQNLYYTGEYLDELYAIPCVQYHTKETISLTTTYGLIEYLDVKALTNETHNNPKTTEKVYEILDDYLNKVKENKGVMSIDVKEFYNNNICKRGYVFIGGADSNICYDPYADKVEIIDFFKTDEFKTYIKWANKWYNDGFISKDVLTGTSVGATSEIGTLGAVTASRYGADENWVIPPTEGNKTCHIVLDNPDNDILASHNIGSLLTYLSIPSTSTNPVRAMKLIELLRTDEGSDILNTIAYGIEGEHYDLVNGNQAKPYDYAGQGNSSSKYGIANWMLGNLYNMYTCYPYDQGVWEYGEQYFAHISKTKKHPLYGYCFDTAPVSAKMSSILAVNKEYETQLAYGVLSNYEKTYNEMLAKIEAADINSVIAEYQKQAYEYIASK